MKNIFFVGFFMLAVGACKKSSEAGNSPVATIKGNWKLYEYYINPGSGGQWRPADAGKTEFVHFNEDGSFKSNIAGLLSDASQYELIDPVSFKLILPQQVPGFVVIRYQLNSPSAGVLEISPPCIEGCMMRFRKY